MGNHRAAPKLRPHNNEQHQHLIVTSSSVAGGEKAETNLLKNKTKSPCSELYVRTASRCGNSGSPEAKASNMLMRGSKLPHSAS